MRNCRKFCKHKKSFGDFILADGRTFTPLEYAKLTHPAEVIGFVGAKSKKDAKVGDYFLNGNFIVSTEDYSKLDARFKNIVGIVGIESKNTPDEKLRIVSTEVGEGIFFGGYNSQDGVNPLASIVGANATLGSHSLEAESFPFDYDAEIPTKSCNWYCNFTDGAVYYLYKEDGTLSKAMDTFEAPYKNILEDLDGELATQAILDELNSPVPETPVYNDLYTCSPAAQYCNNYERGNLKWHLPTAGELSLIMSNLSANFAEEDKLFWTSTLGSSIEDPTSPNNGYVVGVVSYNDDGAASLRLIERDQIFSIGSVLPVASY